MVITPSTSQSGLLRTSALLVWVMWASVDPTATHGVLAFETPSSPKRGRSWNNQRNTGTAPIEERLQHPLMIMRTTGSTAPRAYSRPLAIHSLLLGRSSSSDTDEETKSDEQEAKVMEVSQERCYRATTSS